MRVETGARAEALVALGADVGLLARVCPHVSLEQTRSVKSLATHIAGKHGLLLGQG